MKIGIITGYYSENSGTLLQALSIGNVIKKMGHEVVYIDTKNKYSTHSIKLLIARIIKELIHLKPKNVLIAVKKFFYFNKSIKQFKVIRIEDSTKENIDCFIIGSDTVWNIEDKYFREASTIYFPNIKEIRTIAYAASVGNSKSESFYKFNYIKESLDNMQSIAVRDKYSKGVIEKITNKNVDIVVDPTILIDTTELIRYKKEINMEKDYILIYSFIDFPDKTVKSIKKFARENNLEIVSLGKNVHWCDRQITISIDNFISYYYNAKYVITNTFHGNIFSIIFNKQFLCLDLEKKKIEELLKEYGLENRRYDFNVNISDAFKNQINYDEINKRLADNRAISLKYLKDSIIKGEK